MFFLHSIATHIKIIMMTALLLLFFLLLLLLLLPPSLTSDGRVLGVRRRLFWLLILPIANDAIQRRATDGQAQANNVHCGSGVLEDDDTTSRLQAGLGRTGN